MSRPTRLLLLRHGQTEGPPGVLYSQQDVPLSAEGWRQTETLVQGLARLPLSAVFASDLSRTRLAAERLVARCRVPLHVTPALREIDFGAWSGRRFEDLWEEPAFRERLRDPESISPPGGESLADLARRAEGAVREILERYPGGLVAVFTHGGLLRVLLLRALGAGLGGFFRLQVDCASVSLVDYYPEGPVVRLVNGPPDLDLAALLARQSPV